MVSKRKDRQELLAAVEDATLAPSATPTEPNRPGVRSPSAGLPGAYRRTGERAAPRRVVLRAPTRPVPYAMTM